MKKSKAVLWLATLGLVAGAQEGIAANAKETNKNIIEVLQKKTAEKHDSSTYVTTAADFGKGIEKQKNDSLDITQTVSLLQDSINALVKSYGKDGLNKKINEIKEKYPDFENLSEAKQKEIVMEKFLDKPESISEFVWDIVILILIIRLAIWLSSLWSGSRRR